MFDNFFQRLVLGPETSASCPLVHSSGEALDMVLSLLSLILSAHPNRDSLASWRTGTFSNLSQACNMDISCPTFQYSDPDSSRITAILPLSQIPSYLIQEPQAMQVSYSESFQDLPPAAFKHAPVSGAEAHAFDGRAALSSGFLHLTRTGYLEEGHSAGSSLCLGAGAATVVKTKVPGESSSG